MSLSIVERKIGEAFTCKVRGTPKKIVVYPATKEGGCEGCIFRGHEPNLQCTILEYDTGPCDADQRVDHRNVIFKELIPDQFELMRTIICRLALEWCSTQISRRQLYQGVYIVTKNLYPMEMNIIRNSPANILRNKNNLTPFWNKLRELIQKKMKPITVKDMIEYLGTLAPDYELHCFNDGEPIRVKDSTTDHEKKIVELQFE